MSPFLKLRQHIKPINAIFLHAARPDDFLILHRRPDISVLNVLLYSPLVMKRAEKLHHRVRMITRVYFPHGLVHQIHDFLPIFFFCLSQFRFASANRLANAMLVARIAT